MVSPSCRTKKTNENAGLEPVTPTPTCPKSYSSDSCNATFPLRTIRVWSRCSSTHQFSQNLLLGIVNNRHRTPSCLFAGPFWFLLVIGKGGPAFPQSSLSRQPRRDAISPTALPPRTAWELISSQLLFGYAPLRANFRGALPYQALFLCEASISQLIHYQAEIVTGDPRLGQTTHHKLKNPPKTIGEC